jgi:hypothetical protein
MNRNLSPNIAKGMYSGPRTNKGADYLRGNIDQVSRGALRGASPVNGNADTVRKPVSRGKIKK